MSTEVPQPGAAATEEAHPPDPPATPAPLNVGKRRIAGDIGIQVVARAGNLVLGVVVTLILVRALGVRGFGQWSTLLAIAQIATSFGDLGLTQVAVSRAARNPETEADWLGALLEMGYVQGIVEQLDKAALQWPQLAGELTHELASLRALAQRFELTEFARQLALLSGDSDG